MDSENRAQRLPAIIAKIKRAAAEAGNSDGTVIGLVKPADHLNAEELALYREHLASKNAGGRNVEADFLREQHRSATEVADLGVRREVARADQLIALRTEIVKAFNNGDPTLVANFLQSALKDRIYTSLDDLDADLQAIAYVDGEAHKSALYALNLEVNLNGTITPIRVVAACSIKNFSTTGTHLSFILGNEDHAVDKPALELEQVRVKAQQVAVEMGRQANDRRKQTQDAEYAEKQAVIAAIVDTLKAGSHDGLQILLAGFLHSQVSVGTASDFGNAADIEAYLNHHLSYTYARALDVSKPDRTSVQMRVPINIMCRDGQYRKFIVAVTGSYLEHPTPSLDFSVSAPQTPSKNPLSGLFNWFKKTF